MNLLCYFDMWKENGIAVTDVMEAGSLFKKW